MPRVRIRPRAASDLEQIYDYLARLNRAAADRFADATAGDFDKLAFMPRMGAICRTRNPALAGLRSWPVSRFRNYLIFYLPMEDGIEVVRVYHGARDLNRLLDDE